MIDAMAIVDYAVQVATDAIRTTTVHRTLGKSPGLLEFHRRDMIMDLPFGVDLLILRNKRQEIFDYNLRRENFI
jgi:hypothetical protein